MATIQNIIAAAKNYMQNFDEARFLRAYEFAEKAHKDQKRFSGEPYIIHPLAVAEILLEFHPDESTLIAALLHDVAEDTRISLDDIGQIFGEEVKSLCWGMMKLQKVRSRLNDPQVENLRKLFLAMAKDFRVVLLKLCDRLHNMETLSFVHPDKKERIAQETLNIYAPIAARLGIYRLKSQLEDLSFSYIEPALYADIQSQLQRGGKDREKYMEATKKILLDTLTSEGIYAQVDGRVKSIYSIYRKLKKKNRLSINEIFDLFAMRVILPDIYKYDKEYVGHLYTALGILHNHFTPLANRFKDYVAVPKVNGYRSLHTTVMGLGSKIHAQPTEIQLRTRIMHENAELGIAAHWLYEENIDMSYGNGTVRRGPPAVLSAAEARCVSPIFQQQKAWIIGLEKIEKEIKDNQELMENLQVDIFQDRIFVLTPKGDVKDLPAGATLIDFAYAVHTEIGNHCIGAKVNGSMAPVDYELKSGEVVEIIIRKNARPSQQWLAFVKTNYARNRIRAWFRDLDQDRYLKAGRELMNKKLSQLGRPSLDMNCSILRDYGGKILSVSERSDLIKEMGRGAVLPGAVIKKIFTTEELLRDKSLMEKPLWKADKESAGVISKQEDISIGDDKSLPYHYVKCCNAKGADQLVGYVTRGRGVSVHKKDCKVIRNNEESHRIIPVSRGAASQKPLYPVRLILEADDRIGIIRDVSQLISGNNINIVSLSSQDIANNVFTMHILVEVRDFDQLEILLSKLEKIPSIRRAFKVN